MTQKNQIYKCEICGNIIEVLHEAQGQLVCCNQPMKLSKENTVDAATEKHVPIIEQEENKIKIKVGEVLHPMTNKHYIEFIELITKETVYRKQLNPNESPEAEFYIKSSSFTARAHCNLHGLWKSK